MKNKPLMISALIFGGIGLAIIILAAVFYLRDSVKLYEAIAAILGMTKDKINTTTFCQFGIIFEIAAFILGYRSLKDET